MMNTYFIGGSPCSGKSTIAEIISHDYDLYYFKVDDFLEKYTHMGTLKGYEICQKQEKMNHEETWMREPFLQCREELRFYEEIFEFILEDFKKIQKKDIITEGAAYLPHLMKALNIPINRYISITPTKEFQVFYYKQREWVPYILEGCSNKNKAFSNWMDRDNLFALDVRQQCNETGYTSIVNDGTVPIDELVTKVTRQFQLE